MAELPPLAQVQQRQLVPYNNAGQVPIAGVNGGGELATLAQAIGQGATSIAQGFEPSAMAMRFQNAINGEPMSNTERLLTLFPAADIIGGGFLAGAKVPINALASNAIRRDLPNVEEIIANPMITQHNVTAEGLKIADEIGGLPMPSLAITRADEPLTDFGEISLVADKNMATPSKQTPVYPADAYTGRQPRVFYNNFVDEEKAFDAIRNDPMLGHLKDVDYFHNMYDSINEADLPLKTIQAAVDRKVINPKDYNEFYELKQAASKALGEDRFNSELFNQYDGLSKYGTLKKQILPKGGLFTASGKRRKFPEYTLDEAMKQMRSEKAFKQGSEKGGMLGAGKIRALLLDKFKNLDEIKKNRNLLVSSEEFDDLKHYFDRDVTGAIEDIAEKHFNGNFRGAQDFFEDVIANKNYRWANDMVSDLDEAAKMAKERVAKFKWLVKDMPTEYFEAKPNRAVNLDEFAGAIVPKEITDETRQILEKHGITQIWEYGTEEQRKKLYKQFPDLLFSITSPPVTPMLMPQNDKAPLRTMRPNEA